MRLAFLGKTKATITDVDIQSLKMGQTDVKPAVVLHLRLVLGNRTLQMLDADLLGFLFQRGDPIQQQLDGVEVVSDLAAMTDIAIKLGPLTWDDEQTGSTMRIYQGVTGDQDITLRDVTIRKVKITPQEGGSVEWSLHAYTSDVDQDTIGALAVLKSLERDIELVPAQPVDDRQTPLAVDSPTAEDIFTNAE